MGRVTGLPTPRARPRAALPSIAGAGPLANLALAGVGGALVGLLPWPASRFAWLFMVLNLLLAGFNLLPGLPLDGGQLVQSLVWGVTGRRDLGLVVAGWCGRLLAVGVALWYVARPLAQGTSDLFGVGFGLVMAWILWSGATAALRRAPLERLLRRVRPGTSSDPVVGGARGSPLVGWVGVGRRVVSLDERAGRPCRCRAVAGRRQWPVCTTTLLSSMVMPLADGAFIGSPRRRRAVLRAMASTASVMVTWAMRRWSPAAA